MKQAHVVIDTGLAGSGRSTAIKALEDTNSSGKPVQRFRLGNYDVPAVLEQYTISSDVPQIGDPIERGALPTMAFREMPGTVS